MQDSNILIYAFGELAIVLLAVCVFLCFHVKSLKKLIVKLEEKVTSLRRSISVSRNETKAALKKLSEKERIKPKQFIDFLDQELDQTLQHHQSLNPDRDIVLDITPDAPIERQAASLRHAFLIAEKEARHAGDKQQSSWEVLQAKFQQIIQFYESAGPADVPEDNADDTGADENLEADSEQIKNYKKQIENLQRFKQLFFETEEKWRNAKTEAEQYYKQLMEKTAGQDDSAEYETLLANYAKAYDEIEALMASVSADDDIVAGDIEQAGHRDHVGGKILLANQEEMQRLKNMAVDQHRVIGELKRKLVDAQSPEQQQEVIEQLTQQLEQQQRFLKEAETCTQQIEDELSRTIQENEQLRSQLQGGESGISDDDVQQLETVIEDFIVQSKEMLSTISTLEADNEALKTQLENDGTDESDHQVEQLKEKLGEMQQELLNMQTQHIELEERYLELKMSSES